MNRTRWIIFGVVCFAVLGVLILTNKKTDSGFTGDATKIITQGPIADHVFGTQQQKVVLIEYGDYECPACGAIYSAVKDVATKYQNDLTFIFRNFPLTTIHPNALAAAEVAEAAGLQGKYFEMHDKLYETQSAWSEVSANDRGTYFQQYAQQIGLNITKYKQDLSSAQITDKINRDRETAGTFNVNGTPTFILNGQKMSETDSTSATNFETTVQNALKQAGFTLDK